MLECILDSGSQVAHVAWMGGKYPSSDGSGPEWNFGANGIGPSTEYTFDHWPTATKLTFLGWFTGHEVRFRAVWCLEATCAQLALWGE